MAASYKWRWKLVSVQLILSDLCSNQNIYFSLLHAASLAMWGFHDRRLTLRRALHAILSEGDYRDSLWRRWRFQQTKQNREAGLVFSDTEWAREWEEIVAIASPEPRQARNNTGSARRRSVIVEKPSNESVDTNAVYESLEEIHVLALAYVLRRAIIGTLKT